MHLALFYSTILYYYIWQSCEAGLPRALRLQLQPCGSSSLFFSFSLFPLLLLFFFSSSSLHFFSISSSLVLFFLALSSAFHYLPLLLSSRSIAIPDSCSRNRTYPSVHCNEHGQPRPPVTGSQVVYTWQLDILPAVFQSIVKLSLGSCNHGRHGRVGDPQQGKGWPSTPHYKGALLILFFFSFFVRLVLPGSLVER